MDARHARHHSESRRSELRQRLAFEAARIMSEQGIRDYGLAKRKAAERLGVGDDVALPRNSEIEHALRDYQALFQHDSQPRILRQKREMALEAMRFFAGFEPRLVGSVLEGTADEHSAVCLHLFSDDPLAVANFLEERRIPFEEQTRRIRLDRDNAEEIPVYLFSADDVAIDLSVLPRDGLRQAPLSRIDERPMQRASLATVEALLAEK